MIRIPPVLRALCLVFLPGSSLSAQSIDAAVRGIGTGQVRMSFAAQEDVCSDGGHRTDRRRTADWEGPCDGGPLRVVLHVVDASVSGIDTYVGGRWRPRDGGIRDLGTVSTAEATDFLLRLAEMGSDDLGHDALLPAALADTVVVWPRLLGIARDSQVGTETRTAAVFWLSQAAGAAAIADLREMATDERDEHEVRVMALFALSRLPGDEGFTALLDIARSSDDPDLRRHAMFWLGQTGDPRALAFFEEVLARQ
ncbi:MAG: hypothetical protein AMS20_03020 [Gemmatimonas sp. SG8_28]|nr:MAG: hypothetical protein AMS20_03020 [Gemmatimonas sp. SG8_28]